MVTTTNLIRYWRCNDNAANTTVVDATGTSNGTATTNTSNLSEAGTITNRFGFNGTSEYFTNNIAVDLTKNQNSINIWSQSDDLTENRVIWEHGNGSSNRFLLWRNKNGGGAGIDWIVLFINGVIGLHYAITDNDPHMYTVVLDNDNVELFADSVSQGNTAFTSITRSSDLFTVGRRPANGDYWNGGAEAVAIFAGEALSQTFINELFASGAGLDYPFAVGTNMLINIADTFKDVDSLQINIGDVWKDVPQVLLNVGDTWKTVYG